MLKSMVTLRVFPHTSALFGLISQKDHWDCNKSLSRQTLLENLGGTSEGMPWLCPNGSEPAARALPFSYFLFLLRVYHVRDLVKPHLTCQNANTFNRWKSMIEEETIRYRYQTRKESNSSHFPIPFSTWCVGPLCFCKAGPDRYDLAGRSITQ